MKTILKYLIICLVPSLLFAQKEKPTTAINGTYHLMEAERANRNQTTNTKIFEFGTHNGVELLAIAACKKCMPAVYTFMPKESKELGRTVFFNKTGLYVIAYDTDSFVMIMPNPNGSDWLDFMFSNFYSKTSSKAKAMTRKKIKTFIDTISK